MNGIRPNEILQVLQSAEEFTSRFPSEELILATVISLDGSVYTRAGAMALFVPGDSGGGAIPAQSLEQGLGKAIEDAADERKSRLVALDIGENDPILGYGFCAHGRVEVLLEPMDAALLEHLRKVRQACLNSEGVVCAVEVEGPEVGRRVLYSSDHPTARECYAESSPELNENRSGGVSRRTFLCPFIRWKVLIFGSGPDAACSRSLCGLGLRFRRRFPARAPAQSQLGKSRRACGGRLGEMRSRVQPTTLRPRWSSSTTAWRRTFRRCGGAGQPGGLCGPGERSSAPSSSFRIWRRRASARPGIFFRPAASTWAPRLRRRPSERRGGNPGRPLRPPRRSPFGARPPGAGSFPSGKGGFSLILAAGRGKRSRGSKLAALFEGQPVLRHVVENALASA